MCSLTNSLLTGATYRRQSNALYHILEVHTVQDKVYTVQVAKNVIDK